MGGKRLFKYLKVTVMQIFGGRALGRGGGRAESSQSREASVAGVSEQRDNQEVRLRGQNL